MKPWPPSARRALLVLHVATSVGLIGTVAAFILLAVLAVAADAPVFAGSAYPAMDALARLLILPLAVVSVAVGIALAVVTSWGLATHWWVLAKLVLSLFVLGVLLLQLDGIRSVAAAAGTPGRLDAFLALRWSFVVHAAGGAAVLGVALVLSVYKPKGRTPWAR